MISFSLADVSSLKSKVPRSNFAEADIDNLANLILECNGLVKPIVIKAVDVDNYIVIDGDLEYYAALRAKEKNLRKGEMINALVVPSNTEYKILQQIHFLRKLASGQVAPTISQEPEKIDLDDRLNQFKMELEAKLDEIRAEQLKANQQIEARLQSLEGQKPVEKEIVEIPTSSTTNPLELLNTMSLEKLAIRLKNAKITNGPKLAKSIVEGRENKANKRFTNYRDLVDSVKGLGDKTMLAIIDELSS